MHLHTPTLLLVSMMISVTLGISMGLVARRERRDGMVWWSCGMVLVVLVHPLFGLRGQISDWLSVALGNVVMISIFAFFAEGLSEFQHRVPRRVLIWAPVALMALAQLLLRNEPVTRGLLVLLLMAFQVAVMLGLMLVQRRQTVGRGQYFVMAGLALIIAAMLLRLGAFMFGAINLSETTASTPTHALSVLALTLTIVLMATGLVLMTKERADALNRTLALQDELTGMPNRRAIHKLLEQQLALARRHGQPLSLLIVDVDHFKQINDHYGHLSGDLALREMADRLHRRLRAQDIAGRWGGEEFIVILPGTGIEGARALAETLRHAAEQAELRALDGRVIHFTVSIGLHVLDPAGGNERDDMIAAADRALYLAKQNGRNRVEEL